MSSRNEHDMMGAVVGVATALYSARDQDPLHLALEAIGGWYGGKVGSQLPDVLEPAVHSHHRDICHSLIAALGAGAAAVNKPLGLSEAFRAHAESVRAKRVKAQERGEDGVALLLLLLEGLLRFAAGFVCGLAPGYASHLALDAGTPRSIPLLTRGF